MLVIRDAGEYLLGHRFGLVDVTMSVKLLTATECAGGTAGGRKGQY